MPEARIFRGRELFDAGLVERVIEFDRRNMRRVWERTGPAQPALVAGEGRAGTAD